MIKIPDKMTAIAILAGGGGPDVLVPETRGVPVPGPDEVLIKVAAAGINRPDVMQRQGKYSPPPGASDIPGLEVAGEIVAVGTGVRDWRAGDQACALLAGGGYAQYCVAPAPQCLPVPAGYSMIEAAALPENYFTVWANVFDRGRLKADEKILVHGGASGIGTTAIQLANHFGARVFATAGGADKVRICEELGAVGIDYKSQDFAQILSRVAPQGIDLVLDMVGGDYFARNLNVLAVDGRLVLIATQKGGKAEINLVTVMQRRLTVTGSTLRPRSVVEKGLIAMALLQHVWPILESQKIAPIIDSVLQLTDAAAAHRRMEAGGHIGKIILEVRH